MRIGWLVGLVVLLGPSSALAQAEVREKREFCLEMLDLTGSLLTASVLVTMAPVPGEMAESLEETGEIGEAVPSDPRVREAGSTLSDVVMSVSDLVLAYCRT